MEMLGVLYSTEPVVAELLVAALLTIPFSLFMFVRPPPLWRELPTDPLTTFFFQNIRDP